MSRCTLAALCLALGLAVGLTLADGTALAQEDAPKRVEVFGGYQFLHAGNFDGAGDGSANTSGWNAAATFNFTRHLGFTADFGGGYQTRRIQEQQSSLNATATIQIYTYGFGPTVSVTPGGKFKVFTHALFGYGSVRPNGCILFSGSPDECGSGHMTGMAMMLGGGVDVPVKRSVAFRVAQVDWVYLPSQGGAQTGDVRISSGLVFRF
ncbi:MAG TPA: outer membrane beta-barrel protein [Candidatus Solibacter sp.]|nr:outer membrane beta-barrel protein [Candidatus Solibacter sp.]